MIRRHLPAALVLAASMCPSVAFADEPERAPVVMPAAGGDHRQRDRRPRRPPRAAEETETVRAPRGAAGDGFPLAGYHGGKFYIRDDHDLYRFYPGLLVQLDARAMFGRGVDDLPASAGDSVRSHMFFRRVQPSWGGQILDKWSWVMTAEVGNGTPRLDHSYVNVEVRPWLNIEIGQMFVPLTMENRSAAAAVTWMERPLVTKLANQSFLDLGAMVHGQLRRGLVAYQVGVFGGEGQNRNNADNRVDVAGRVYAKPLAWTNTIAKDIQIGASALWGMRRPGFVNYDYTPLDTDGGYRFWDTQYFDGSGRRIHILPSGRQTAVAGEARVPVSKLDFRFEFTAVRKGTREAVDGFQATNTERFGHLSGNAFYAQLGFWIVGSPVLSGKPGDTKPPKIAFPRGHSHVPMRGVELLVRGESLRATYSPGDRANVDAVALPEQDIKADMIGAGVNYYATQHAKLSLNYGYYMFPGSARGDNAAVAPGNLGCSKGRIEKVPGNLCHNGAHSLHEVGFRAQIAF